jgi:hypothetical protein
VDLKEREMGVDPKTAEIDINSQKAFGGSTVLRDLADEVRAGKVPEKSCGDMPHAKEAGLRLITATPSRFHLSEVGSPRIELGT